MNLSPRVRLSRTREAFVNLLEIDAEIIRNAKPNPVDQVLTQALIFVCHTRECTILPMSLIAEVVEKKVLARYWHASRLINYKARHSGG